MNSDLILLPYKIPDYLSRTSGLFFESISLNKPTFVTDGTLMSQDLRKFKLRQFIVKDWSKLSFRFLEHALNSRQNAYHLNKFSDYYKKINGNKNFANKLANVTSNII